MINANRATILKNGLRVLFIEQKELKDSGLGISIPAGPYWEDKHSLGISHLTEHLISRLDVDGGDLRELIYQKGGVFDAATSISQTYFFLYTLNEDLLGCSKTFIKGIFRPRFREGALVKSKESIISEIAHSRKLTSYEILRDMMWKNDKFKRPLMGEKDTILFLGLDNISDYHKRRYLTSGVSAVVIGPSFPQKLEESLSEIPLKSEIIENSITAETKEPDYRIFEEGDLHSTLTFCFPTKGYKNLGEGRHVFRLAASVLNSTYISALSESGLIYQSSWSWNVFPDSGEFVFEFSDLAPEHVLGVTQIATRLINNWSNLSISESEFALIKKQRILAVRMVEGLSESLPLITKDFASSQEAHTFEEAVSVYEKATQKECFLLAREILLTKKPFLVVNMGDDSLKYANEVGSFLEDYYKKDTNND